jgi:hypothetical protein
VDRLADPVDASIATDSLVLGVDTDDLEVLVGRVLVDPVGVQDTQVGAAAAHTLLSGGLEGTLVLELVDTVVGGLAVGGTLGDRALATTAADTDAVDNVALLSLVAETAGLVGARGARSTVDGVQLTELYLCTLSKVQRVYSKTQDSVLGGGLLRATKSISAGPVDFGSSLAIPLKRHSRWQRTRVSGGDVKRIEGVRRGLSHLPASDAQQEANHVGLLLLLDLFHVLEGTHLEKGEPVRKE